MDRFDCYELCVQGPRWVVPFLRALHGEAPQALREDYCGSAAVARRWIADARREGLSTHRAIGIDLDPDALSRAAAAASRDGVADALDLRRADALLADDTHPCDVVFVGNFSIGYIHRRDALVEYLRRSRARLAPRGIFVCDTYGAGLAGAASAWRTGGVTRVHHVADNRREAVRYTWEQRDADALTGMVHNVLHFQVELDGEVIARFPDAFVYRWRLWSVPELREAMHEAGFAATEVHEKMSERPEPVAHARELGEAGIVCVVAR